MARARHQGARRLGILMVILGLVHAPLPQPDFHNIRHHDGPGEVCEHHDHLLRWHPGAGVAADVSVLHWHWFVPTADPLDNTSTDPHGPALHAHVVDWQAPSWEGGPLVTADTTARFVPGLDRAPAPGPAPSIVACATVAPPTAPDSCRVRTFGATFAPTAPLACLYQRWDC
jgi:hypothetical protein